MIEQYNNIAGATGCETCTWPATTLLKGSTGCNFISINFNNNQLIYSACGFVAFYIMSVAAAGVVNPALVAFTIFPAMDVISDILYLLQTTFENQALFFTCIVFIFLPNSIFIFKIYRMGALVPSFLVKLPSIMVDRSTLLWLGEEKGYPLYYGEKLRVSFDRHDSLMKLVSYWIVWVVCIIVQMFTVVFVILLYIPVFAVHIPFWIVWLLLGFYCNQIKAMAIKRVWTVWFQLWTNSNKFDSKAQLVDTGVMNEAIFAEFMTETIPQLVLQSLNNQATKTWTSIGIFSTSLSIFMAINGALCLINIFAAIAAG